MKEFAASWLRRLADRLDPKAGPEKVGVALAPFTIEQLKQHEPVAKVPDWTGKTYL